MNSTKFVVGAMVFHVGIGWRTFIIDIKERDDVWWSIRDMNTHFKRIM